MAIRKWLKALVSPRSERRNARSMMEEDVRQWRWTEEVSSVAKSAPEYGEAYEAKPLFARVSRRKSAAKHKHAAHGRGISAPLPLKHGLPSFIGDERLEPLTHSLVMDTVDRLAKIFAHVPFLVQGSAALAYHGHSAARPNMISLACPPNAVSIMLGGARDMQMPFSSTAPSTFYVHMGYETLCCVRVVARHDYGELRAAQGSQVLSLPSLANDTARHYLEAERRQEDGLATKMAADMFWLLNRMAEAAPKTPLGRPAGLVARPDFVRLFVARYPRAKSALERAGVLCKTLPSSLDVPPAVPRKDKLPSHAHQVRRQPCEQPLPANSCSCPPRLRPGADRHLAIVHQPELKPKPSSALLSRASSPADDYRPPPISKDAPAPQTPRRTSTQLPFPLSHPAFALKPLPQLGPMVRGSMLPLPLKVCKKPSPTVSLSSDASSARL
ncbi:hypothetical protein CDD81_104 [Ophiocordyceps australis]|uniref:Uncharacterized protein n=1 Tax=Ophiocordyceps australis TaxID=1399860 RepID=A0A2C5XCI5_9HYPO|nr:hypothetical protein CDD81_104 [Ophiocordyceps australis]